MSLLSIIPDGPWAAAAVGAGVLCAAVCVQTVRLSDEKADRALDQRDFAIERTNAAKAAEAQITAYRTEETRRADAQKAIDDETRTRLAAAEADAAIAAGASRRLSERVAGLVNAARSAAANPTIAGKFEATDPAPMLADVFGRLDSAAGRYAAAADAARIAGLSCESAYDALTAR